MGEKEQGRKIPHSKKNPYIMTIGFDRTDPRHVEVADFLNSLQRKKAQYIVDAVIYYQGRKENEIVPAVSGRDYENIRSIVLQILKEQNQNTGLKTATKEQTENKVPFMEEEELNGILNSISVFRR